MSQQSIACLESAFTLNGTPCGRAIMPTGLPWVGFGTGTKPSPLPSGVNDSDWDWFVAKGPKLPLALTGITLIANSEPATGSQNALLIVLLDQNKRYYRACGNTYPVGTQPSDQSSLTMLGIVEFRAGMPRVFDKDFERPIILTADDCIIVDTGGTGTGATALAWQLRYDPTL